MAEVEHPVDFDTRPPMPVGEYDSTVRRVNVGYELLFTLTHCLLRALHQPALELLVVGAGGGAEIEKFLPGNPGWRLTGLDPSQDMLRLAQAKADRLGVADRVTLIRGTIQDLPAGARFDAATCIFVLHFLSDDAKVALLRGTASHLRPRGPLLAAAGAPGEDDGLMDLIWDAWQEYGVAEGLPAQQMADTLRGFRERGKPTGWEEYPRLFRAAGFKQVAPYFNGLNVISGWIAR